MQRVSSRKCFPESGILNQELGSIYDEETLAVCGVFPLKFNASQARLHFQTSLCENTVVQPWFFKHPNIFDGTVHCFKKYSMSQDLS